MRQQNALRYRQLITDCGLDQVISLPTVNETAGHVWHQFTIRIPDGRRDEVRAKLAEMNVGSEVYYPVPLHQQECFKHLKVDPAAMIETSRAAGEVLSLPIFPELTEAEQVYVVECLKTILPN